MPKLSRIVVIENRLGLHARAAVKLVQLAQAYQAVITLETQDHKIATADTVMGILMLESAQGQRITVWAEGEQAEQALEAVCHLITDKFEEQE